jgi:2-polyprenyl-3-methyl-5-hydroxy-6-metoxy-1,4-benzoquinol methylase
VTVSVREDRPPSAAEDVQAQLRALAEAVAEARAIASDARRRVTDLEAELRRLRASGGDGHGAPEARQDHPEQGGFGAIYPGFQERFRGSRQEIRLKLQPYLADVRRVVGEAGVLDVGAGRGEWLHLLREAGVRASGVDTHPAFVRALRMQGLDVALADAVSRLRAQIPGSLDMVTAFHVIEHVDIEYLLELLTAAADALRTGGCLLLETPNPTNLTTGACDFYCDPTHRSPLPPALTEYLMSVHGFADIEVRPLHPKPSPFPPTDAAGEDPVREMLERVLFGPQDYAVLGYRAPRGDGA